LGSLPLPDLVRDKEFTSDWCSGNFTLWRRVFSTLRGKPLNILEIGSWEGRSAIFRQLLRARDHHLHRYVQRRQRPQPEQPPVSRSVSTAICSLRPSDREIKGLSRQALATLAAQQRRYDLAYIDGSHERDDVMADILGCGRCSIGAAASSGTTTAGAATYHQSIARSRRSTSSCASGWPVSAALKGYQVLIERLR